MKKTQLFLTAAALTIVGGVALSTSQVWASTNQLPGGHQDVMVQKLVQKFNLDQAAVQAVFDEQHQEMMAQHRAERTARFDQLVADGKITQDQRNLIVAKMAELDSKRDASPEERRQAMELHREEMETWAAENGIDLQYLRPMNGDGRGSKGFGPMSE